MAIPARGTAQDIIGPSPGDPRPDSARQDWWATLWFGLGLAAGFHRLSDNSFLTHLATGRLIVDDGIPRSDPYTFTAAGRPWVVQSWAFSWFQARVESLVGAWGIRFALGLVIGTLLVAIWRLSRPAETLVGRMTVTALAAVVGLGWWNERPQTVAFLLAALSLVVVLERRSSGWLVPIFGIWVVVHGSWLFGLVIVGCLALVDRRWRRWWELPGAAALGVAIGALVSPSAWDQVAFPIRMLGHREVLAYIVEWRRPAWSDPVTWAFAAQVVVAAWALWRTRRAGWATLAAGLVAAALVSRRNIPLASIVMVPAMAPAFARLGRTPVGCTPNWSRLLTARAVLVVAAGIAVFASPQDYDLGPFPTAAVDWMERRALVARPGVRVAAPDYAGNYLEWRFGAAANVFVDDRAEVLDAEVIGDYVRGLLDDELDWRTVLDRYRIDVVLWPGDQRLAREIVEDPGWRTVHRSGGWIVACRRAGGPDC